MSIQALREQRAAKAIEAQTLANKDKWDAAKDGPVYDALMNEIGDLDGRIKRINDSNALLVENAISEQVIAVTDRFAHDKKSPAAKIFSKWLRGGDRALTNEDWAVVRATMSTTTATEGGYTVATETAQTVIDSLKAFGGMRRVATVITTEQGGPMNWPTSDGTSEEGEIVAENAAVASADIAFGVKTLPVYKFSSKVVTVPIELLQDSSIDIEAFVRQRLVTRLGRITNRMFTVGTGSSQPMGLLAAATSAVTAAAVAVVTYDELVNLEHAVDPAYREGGQCGWMMHDDAIKMIRKIKDTQGRPIFVPGYDTLLPGQSGAQPSQLLGRPIETNQHILAPATGVEAIAFGDFSKYIIRDALDISMLRFTDSAYAKNGQVGFLAFLRSGGNLSDAGAVKTLTMQ